MSENSKIQWTDHTFNPWTGCAKVSPGCENCYAEGWAKRSGIVQWGPGKDRRRTKEAYWREPIKWNDAQDDLFNIGSFQQLITTDGRVFRGSGKELAELGILNAEIGTVGPARPRVFSASLADWLDPEVPIEWLVDFLELIRSTPNLDWLLLTKRPQLWLSRMRAAYMCSTQKMEKRPLLDKWIADWLPEEKKAPSPPSNVWIGTTAEDQKRANERIPLLLEIPAEIRFLSCEPLLEPICHPGITGKEINMERRPIGESDPSNNPDPWNEFEPVENIHPTVDWLIVGGESGGGHRPFNPKWARSLLEQCTEGSVPFFMKQMGGTTKKAFDPIPKDLMIREFPTSA